MYLKVVDLLKEEDDYEMEEELDSWASEHSMGDTAGEVGVEQFFAYITEDFLVDEVDLLKKHGLKLPTGRETVRGWTTRLAILGSQELLEFCKRADCLSFQELMVSHGHLAEMSPKCHLELAGVGVEYSWGKAKMHFRRHTDHISRHLHANIEAAMASDVLTLLRVRRYARKARAYRRA